MCTSIVILSFIVLIFAWNVPLVSLIFLKRSLVFAVLFFSSISLHWSRRKAFLSLLAILWKFSLAAHSCPTLCDPMDCSLPDSSVHGIFQARILEWRTISSFRASSQSRDRTHISCVSCRFFTTSTTKATKRGAQSQQAPGFEEPPGRRSGGPMWALFTPTVPWVPGCFS